MLIIQGSFAQLDMIMKTFYTLIIVVFDKQCLAGGVKMRNLGKLFVYFCIILLFLTLDISMNIKPANSEEFNSSEIVWRRNFGGGGDDYADCMQQTEDGGFIIAGKTNSFGDGGDDVYLLKTDKMGNCQWQKTFGGAENDFSEYVQQTSDEGYIIVGSSNSFGNGSDDVYLIKTDASGNLQWQKTFGGSKHDHGMYVQETSDKGYIVAGDSYSMGQGISPHAYIVRTDIDGNILWERYFEEEGSYAVFAQQGFDGYFTIFGGSFENLNEPSIYMAKIDDFGNKIDLNYLDVFPGYCELNVVEVQQTSDGGFILTGVVSPDHNPTNYDVYLHKVDINGSNMWEDCFGRENAFDFPYCVKDISKNEGGCEGDDYIVAGYTESIDPYNADAYIFRYVSGRIVWERTYGWSESDRAIGIVKTENGGYVVAGYTDIPQNDIFLMNIDLSPQIFSISPEAGKLGDIITISGDNLSGPVKVEFRNDIYDIAYCTEEFYNESVCEISFGVPSEIWDYLEVTVITLEATSNKAGFTSLNPFIRSITLSYRTSESDAVILGNNFGDIQPEDAYVCFILPESQSILTETIFWSDTEIRAKVPDIGYDCATSKVKIFNGICSSNEKILKIIPKEVEWLDIYSFDGYENYCRNVDGFSLDTLLTTDDGGYLLAGGIKLKQTSEESEPFRFHVVKYDESGKLLWNKIYEIGKEDPQGDIKFTSLSGGKILPAPNGHYIAGYSLFVVHNDNHYSYSLVFFEIDGNGNILWERLHPMIDSWTCNVLNLRSATSTNDGGYIFCGQIYPSGELRPYGLLLKIDSQGNLSWLKKYNGCHHINSIQETSDISYIMVGGRYYLPSPNDYIIKTDEYGNIIWERCFNLGGPIYAIRTVSENSYIFGGHSIANEGSHIITGKIDDKGNLLCENILETKGRPINDIQFTKDGNYLFYGIGDNGCFIIITDSNNNLLYQWDNIINVIDEPSLLVEKNGGFVICGATECFWPYSAKINIKPLNHLFMIRTFPLNTFPSTNTEIRIEGGFSIYFDNVIDAGYTNVVKAEDPQNAEFQIIPGSCYDISTTATYTGKIRISLPYDETELEVPEEDLRLFHYENGSWVDVTLEVDTENNRIIGEVESLSPFVIGWVKKQTSISIATSGPVQYSDPITITATLMDEAGQPIQGKPVTFAFEGAESGPIVTNISGNATWSTQVFNPPGNYEVSAEFAGDARYLGCSAAGNLSIVKENLLINYAGDYLVRVNQSVKLAADLCEIDTSFGDITKAAVVFEIYDPQGNKVREVSAPVLETSPGKGKAELETAPLPTNVYKVQTRLDLGNQFYYANEQQTDLAVYNPQGGFTAGAGSYREAGILKSFGFDIKYSLFGCLFPKGYFCFTDWISLLSPGRIEATQFMWLVIPSDQNIAYVAGTCKFNGQEGYAFRLIVEDRSLLLPKDVFYVQVLNSENQVVYESQGTVSVGGILVQH